MPIEKTFYVVRLSINQSINQSIFIVYISVLTNLFYTFFNAVNWLQ